MEAIPRVIAQAKANLQHPPRVHTETAIEQTQGAINLVRAGLSPLLDRAQQMKNELAPLQEKTAAALQDYKNWLQNDLLPRSDGNFQLGVDKYRKKLHFALASDLSMEEIMKRAQDDLKQTQTAIYETALPLYKNIFRMRTLQRLRTNIRSQLEFSINSLSSIPTTRRLLVTRKTLLTKRRILLSRIILLLFRTRHWM